MTKQLQPLSFNVGFIIHETPGYTRNYFLESPYLELSDDLFAKEFKGKFTFSRTQRAILVEAELTATFPTECVRCLEATLTTIHSNFTELYAFDQRSITDSGLIVPENGYIDLAPLAREYFLLDHPIAPLCKPDCAGLCPSCGENLNRVQCSCNSANIDPRLSKLKDLLDK